MSRLVWFARLVSSALICPTLLFGATGCAGPAETNNAQGAPSRGGVLATVSQQDQRFVAEAVPAGLAEVELGQLAARRASSEAVRAFAQRMVDDHSQTNERLLAFAQHYEIDAPKRLNHEHAQTKDALTQLQGEAFDRAYMQSQLAAHQQEIALYQRQAQHGKAAALQALAQTTEPTLREHLQAAREIARELPQTHGASVPP